ncbi:MAG TPA: PIN domain-containing protein [Candidatus Nanoarchaeia archaeon]|nr:PIN domain-containing protein [Candidatus Nanoarchaeia archaeon]
MTTEFTLKEVEKYLPYIAGKAELPVSYIKSLLAKIPLTIVNEKVYEDEIPKAKLLIKDRCDIDILALALSKKCPLWSEDKHFKGITEIVLMKTKDFV